ncbi:unnamed protein product [Dibothriocephalus latus]|uniref:Uncharacterized protein n=1 Tax=Dibothriocephalus latus TaxID=60516 RepID=A0A3P7MC10_DIBLA|nr:unnamed protein product [Dibothriocephalus latus]
MSTSTSMVSEPVCEPVRQKRRARVRRRLSAQADKLLLLLHSLFPCVVYAILIYQQFYHTAAANSVRAGYWVGGMGIFLQFALVFWPILPHSELLLLSFAVIEAVCALLGGTITLIQDSKQRFIGAVCIASVVFTILPMYLTISTLKHASKSKKEEAENDEKVSNFSSGWSQEYKEATIVDGDKAPIRQREDLAF